MKKSYKIFLLCVVCLMFSIHGIGQKLLQTSDTLRLGSKKIITNDFEIENDKSYSLVNEYDLSGNLKCKYFTKNGFKFGICLCFYESGELKSISNYYNDRKIDDEFSFHKNGQVSSKGSYVSLWADSTLIVKHDTIFKGLDKLGEPVCIINNELVSNKDGIWLFWDEKGNLTKKEFFKSGILISAEEF